MRETSPFVAGSNLALGTPLSFRKEPELRKLKLRGAIKSKMLVVSGFGGETKSNIEERLCSMTFDRFKKLLIGGKIPDMKRWFFEPTLLTDCTIDKRIA